MDTSIYLTTLRNVWGYEDFRGIQRDIIESIGSGRDTLGLMPTGGGKSITFQVPALTMPGTCLVITPLIALIKDQVRALKQLGIRVAAVYSGQSRQENIIAMDNCILGGYKFLYVSPERLSSEFFIAKLRHMKVSFITVDEAHCISQWGYDFRPSYLQIAQVREVLPKAPVLALTATATPEVVSDIQHQLHFASENVFRMSFERKNLAYQVVRADSKFLSLTRLLHQIPGSCIIYQRNRQHCQDLAAELQKQGFSAAFYHAGLPNSEKTQRQEDWTRDRTRIMVATNAFGMGIDKPDVRLVVHLDIPDSIEEYFQEAGRAGRDGQPSFAILIIDGKETEVARRRLSQNFPKEEFVSEVYDKVCDFLQIAEGFGQNVTREFNLQQFCISFHYHPVMVSSALTLLTRAGYIQYADEDEGTSRLRIIATRGELYRVADARAESILNSLLRHYGGIFVDYVYIDEDMICRETRLDMDAVYTTLVNLARIGFVAYIPRKRVPRITFRQPRLRHGRVSLPASVYGQRRESYAARLGAMLNYTTQTNECRSRLLLAYFGEKSTHDCGQCDVCLQERPKPYSDADFDRLHRLLLEKLEKGPAKAYDLGPADANEELLTEVLRYMAEEEEVVLDGLMVRLRE